MPQIRFEEKSAWNSAVTGYKLTNEEPELFNHMLGRRRFKRAGGIASGGEVLFSVLLPRAEDAVVVDHSVYSLSYCHLKALMLDALGPKGMRDLLLHGTEADVSKVVGQVRDALPKELQKVAYDGYATGKVPPMITGHDHTGLRREWHYMSPKRLAEAHQKLDRALLVHGDLSDIKPYGPFDLFYISNAMEHTNRERKSPTHQDFNEHVAPGGLLLNVEASGQVKKDSTVGWELLKQMKGFRTTWNYQIWRRKAA